MGKRIGAGKRGRSPGRAAVLLGAGALVTGMLAGCGSGGGLKINVYYAPEDSFQKVVDNCNQAAGGRYEIVYNKLQRGSDDQRLQMAQAARRG